MFEKSDERILGDGAFVEKALSAAEEQLEKSYRLQDKDRDLEKFASRMCDLMRVEPVELWAQAKSANGLRQEVYDAVGR